GGAGAVLVGYVEAGVSVITPNVTPCGSARTAKRPTSGMSLGGDRTWPPSSAAFAAVLSVSSLPNTVIQNAGIPGGTCAGIGAKPPTPFSPRLKTLMPPKSAL